MERDARLRGSKRFSQIYKEGLTKSNDLLVIKVLPNGLPDSRFGFAVGKALGGAVVRNKLRRWLRETLRLMPVSGGWDIIFIARGKVREADFHQIAEAVMDLLGQARLLPEK